GNTSIGTGGAIAFNSVVNGQSPGGQSLSLAAAGNVSTASAVGVSTPLNQFSVSTANAISLDGAVSTTGPVSRSAANALSGQDMNAGASTVSIAANQDGS